MHMNIRKWPEKHMGGMHPISLVGIMILPKDRDSLVSGVAMALLVLETQSWKEET